MFAYSFTESAVDDLRHLKKSAQIIVVSGIESQLSMEPTKETRNRKPLRPNQTADWELRVGIHRVFYDVDDANKVVTVKAVGWKDHNKLFIRGKEFEL